MTAIIGYGDSKKEMREVSQMGRLGSISKRRTEPGASCGAMNKE